MRRGLLLIAALCLLAGCAADIEPTPITYPSGVTQRDIPPFQEKMEDEPIPQGEPSLYLEPGAEIHMAHVGNRWLYISQNLRIECEKFVIEDERQVYVVADIRFPEGQPFFTTLAKDFGRGTLRMEAYAQHLEAVYIQSGDYLTEEADLKGILIKRGEVIHEGTGEDTLAFMPDGALQIFSPGEITAQELLDMGVTDTFSFGPTMVRDGEVYEAMRHHRIDGGKNPRSAIGMVEKGHYIGIVVLGRDESRAQGMTCQRLAQIFLDYGCTLAYNLDGGSSADMVLMGKSLINDEDAVHRALPDAFGVGVTPMGQGNE